jgi:hypothetical protein
MLEYWKQGMAVELAAARVAEWHQVAAGYRQILAEAEEWRRARLAGGERETRDTREARETGAGKKPRGRPSRAGALMTEAEMLGHQVRYFTDGLVLGSREFVEQAFALARSWFGPKRKSGARKLARADTGLRVMRDLKKAVYR